MKKNKHIGSSFEDFLQAEGILEEVNVAAIKAVIARHSFIFIIEAHVNSNFPWHIFCSVLSGSRIMVI